jgi:4-hydroxybenzoate polyprenyltransferase
MMEPTLYTDIDFGAWLNRHLPPGLRPYARLLRLDRPIGTWLLLIPCWWGVALACPQGPDLWLMFLFAIGAVVMRGAGCIVNDIYDRKLDMRVERTSVRPLASGEIKMWQAVLCLILLLLIGFGILSLFNRFTVGLGVASIPLILAYPLMKRITWWPQLFLGFTFNWGALMGWSAVTGGLGVPALILYIAGIFWTLGYDTIYAYQDRRDDEQVNIKSTARLLGDKPMPWVTLFYALVILLLALAGWADDLGRSFYILLVGAAAFIAVQLALWHIDEPDNCLRRFRANRNFGLIILAAIILGKFV